MSPGPTAHAPRLDSASGLPPKSVIQDLILLYFFIFFPTSLKTAILVVYALFFNKGMSPYLQISNSFKEYVCDTNLQVEYLMISLHL